MEEVPTQAGEESFQSVDIKTEVTYNNFFLNKIIVVRNLTLVFLIVKRNCRSTS